MLCGYENTCVRTGSPGIAKKEEQVYDVFRLKYYLSTLTKFLTCFLENFHASGILITTRAVCRLGGFFPQVV